MTGIGARLGARYPAGNEDRALAALAVMQILGERVAEMRGIDTEAPRHLSKVVVLA